MPESKPPATFVSDLRPSRVATIEAMVAELEPTREVETRDGSLRKVRNARLRDATGEIALILWGKEVDLVAEGERVRIVEGWVSDYRGRALIALGRSGRIEKVAPAPPGASGP
jgi:ssDNA-binding replication factor A large subunit